MMNRFWRNYITSGISLPGESPDVVRVAFINSFSILGIVTLLTFGLTNIVGEQNFVTGLVEIGFGVLLILNLIVLRVMKLSWIPFASEIMTISIGFPLVVLLFTGGIEGTGIFWAFTFPVTVFLLEGKKKGAIWVSILCVLFLILTVGSHSGSFHLYYSDTEVRQLIFALLIVSGVIYFFENISEKKSVIIEKQQKNLIEINDLLSQKPESDRLAKEELEVKTSRLHEQTSTLKESQAAILNVVEDLDEEKAKLKQKEQELEQANIKLLELDKLKDEFVSIASHELRTPMGAIRAFASMILAGDYGKVSENLKEPLTDIKTSTERLVLLVNDLLSVARIEAGRMKFNLVDSDINTVIKNVTDSLVPLAKQKNLDLGFKMYEGKPILAQMDVDKVKQVLTNLIGNSLKFTDKGGITLNVQKVDDMIEVDVTDTGVGIAKEDQEKLFGKFQQANVSGDRPAGTGLGLYISREMIRKMGGEIRIKSSELGKGSTFTFSLPLADCSEAKEVKETIAQEAEAHPDQK